MVTPIYAPLKWRDVISYVLALGCLLAVLFAHFLARLLYRNWKLDRLKKREMERAGLLRQSQISDSAELVEDREHDNLAFRKIAEL
jgi:hypothetical protein